MRLPSRLSLLVAAACSLVGCAAPVDSRAHDDLTLLADILGGSCAPAIEFQDHARVQEIADRIASHEAIRLVAIYDRDQKQLGLYRRTDGETAPRIPLPTPAHATRDGNMEVCRPIEAGGKVVGLVFVRRDQ